MKKSLLYIGVLLLTLFSCKKDADLTEIIPYQFSPTSVEVSSQSVTLKADIQTSQSIQEKGFILERTYKSDFNYDNSSLDTIVIAADAPFECTITSDMEKDQPCTAFAYIKQNGHYYRNEEVTFMPTGCMPPSITSVTSGFDNQTGKYLIIKGENFSKEKNRNKLVRIIEGGEYYFRHEIVKATSTELLVSHNLTEAGDLHDICLYVGNAKSTISRFMLEGPSIVSWTPQHPRYGEIICLETKGFNKEWELSIGSMSYWNGNPQITAIEDNCISILYLCNDKDTSFGIRSHSPEYYIRTGTIETSIPWLNIGQSQETNHQSYEYINEKFYVADHRDRSGQFTLRCYDFNTEEWSSYPYEALAYTPQSQMWHRGKYIYLLQTFSNEWNPTEIKILRRFDTQSEVWEIMKEAPLSIDSRGVCNSEEYAYIYYEKECYQYSNSNDTWTKLDGIIEPDIAEIVGQYEGYTYYITTSGDLYRIQLGATGKAEFIVKCTESWQFLYDSIKLVGHNLYLCTSNKGIVKYDLISNTFKHLGLPENLEYSYVSTNYSFIEKGNDLYIFGGRKLSFYQYVEDRNE